MASALQVVPGVQCFQHLGILICFDCVELLALFLMQHLHRHLLLTFV